jgi:hypothetical protein
MRKDFLKDLKSNLKTAKSILNFCSKNKAEFLPTREGYMVAVARKLSPEQEAEFKSMLPDERPVEFAECPKLQTKINVENIIQRLNPTKGLVTPDLENRAVKVELEGVPEDHPVWGEIGDVLKADGFFDTWKFIGDGQEINVISKMVDEVAKNKGKRTTLINENDITDLKISLANAQSIDDILKAMEG